MQHKSFHFLLVLCILCILFCNIRIYASYMLLLYNLQLTSYIILLYTILYIVLYIFIAYFWPVFPRISCMGCITGKTSFPFSIVIIDDNCLNHCLGLSLLFVFYEFITSLSVFLLDIRV